MPFEYLHSTRGRKLPRSFYARAAREVARDLLGMQLVQLRDGVRRVGRIVETEAYEGPEDLAAHSAGGRRTARTEVMYGQAGHAYVYLIYGIWHCLNVVCATRDTPHAVLLRALEPALNIEAPTWGPGLLCRALAIDRADNGADLCGGALWIERPHPMAAVSIGRSARIGVEYARSWARRPWRFFDRESAHVSTARAARRRRTGGG